jgi:hypothetical protein
MGEIALKSSAGCLPLVSGTGGHAPSSSPETGWEETLFYYVGRDRFLFGSEIKALLADPDVPAQPDPVALDHFLALHYIPSPLTAFAGIRKLPPAHWLEVRDGHVQLDRYWKLHYTLSERSPYQMRSLNYAGDFKKPSISAS